MIKILINMDNKIKNNNFIKKILIISNIFVRNRNFFINLHIRFKKILNTPDFNNRYLNIGGGGWYYPRWENIDFHQRSVFVDHIIDLRIKKSLPFMKNSVRAIFSSHCFEHLPQDSVFYILKECYRILKSGGIIRLSVPDLDKAFKAYYKGDHSFFDKGGGTFSGNNLEEKLMSFFGDWRGSTIKQEVVKKKLKKLSKFEFVDWVQTFVPKDENYSHHANGFNFDKLLSMLKEIGFQNIINSNYRKSNFAVMREKEFDKYPKISLYIEANK